MEVGKPAIASDGNRFAIEVIVLVYISGIGLIILVGIIGGDAIAGLTYPLAVSIYKTPTVDKLSLLVKLVHCWCFTFH